MGIQLTIAVDTASLPTANGSTFDNPQTFGHDGAFMMTDGAHCVGGNGTATLNLRADVEDSLQVFGTSLSNQLQDEVFIYDFKHLSGDTVLDTLGLKPQSFNQVAKVPERGGPTHNPPTFTTESRTFPCTEIDVTSPGTESFLVRFMVFGPEEAGDRPLKGFYQWDPSISVSR